MRPVFVSVPLLAVLLYSHITAAIVITQNQDAITLGNTLLAPNSNLTVDSATLSASDSSQTGTFTNSSGVYGLPSLGGVVFSTGSVINYADGPNLSPEISGEFGTLASPEQNVILSPLTGVVSHFDPVQLDITFSVASATTVTFFGSFGSEEWPEYVNDGVNDGFSLRLNGVDVAGVLPTGGLPGDPLLPININNPDFKDIRGTELDGVLAPNGNPLLRFDVPVTAGVNTFQILLADAGDNDVDSTMYLSSLGELGASEFTPILPDPNNPTNTNGDFVFDLPEVQAFETIWIDPDVATGYIYSTDGEFASVTAPSLAVVNDADGYLLEFMSGGMLQQFALLAGETFDFMTFDPLSTFTITGINLGLGLDPANPAAFVTGISFTQTGQFSVTQSPIVTFVDDPTNVPEPSSLLLFSLGLGGFLYRRRKLI